MGVQVSDRRFSSPRYIQREDFMSHSRSQPTGTVEQENGTIQGNALFMNTFGPGIVSDSAASYNQALKPSDTVPKTPTKTPARRISKLKMAGDMPRPKSVTRLRA
ncbi:hypothetical protein PENANT_c004G08832 [Penicillium antarcticum]|uniref:Uncharacterized protein n=1 Tax=Penicillium antarcticum TaxID=416450 RepID=A0A1V6QGE3_9EURO|nr:hypothetical protein PENANT_c004G08832 [Penicillium antarcticum]